MKRLKKLTIHISIIAVLLFLFYYFGGYYFSQEQCIKETLRGLYGTETKRIMELENGNYTATLFADTDKMTMSIVGTKKIGFLYHTAESSVDAAINQTGKFYPHGIYNSQIGFVIFLYRNEKSIDRIEVTMSNGKVYVLDEWNNDFVGLKLSLDEISDDIAQGIYRAYDASNQLIDERKY